MSENFTGQTEQPHFLDRNDFEMRFSQFMSDPTGYLAERREEYLAKQDGEMVDLIVELIDETLENVEYASMHMPQAESNELVQAFQDAREHDTQYADLRNIFQLLKQAGFTYEEVLPYVEVVSEDATAEDALSERGDRVILNEVYGNK